MMKFIYMCVAMARAVRVAQEKQRQINLHEQKLKEWEQRRSLNETKLARANNALVLQDLEIERKILEARRLLLEVEKLQKEVHPPRYNPEDPDENFPN